MAAKRSTRPRLQGLEVPSLGSAERALEKGDARGALEAVLEAWRASRLPAFAEVARAITLRATQGRRGLDEALKGADYHSAWEQLAAADDVLDVIALSPGLLREPLGMSLVGRVTQLIARAEDPRIVDALLAMVLEPPATSQGIMGKLYGPVFSALEASADSRLRPALEKYLEKIPGGASLFWPQHLRRVEKLLAKLPAEAPTAEPAVSKVIAGLLQRSKQLAPAVGKKASTTTDAAALTAAGTPAGRLVAADAFLEKGDPRGIAIQLGMAVEAGTATAAQVKELRELVTKHADKWIPPELRPVLTPKCYEFRLGFLDECEVITTSLAQQKALTEHPGWSTVRTLYTDELPLLTSPAFRSLETIAGCSLETLFALGASSRPLGIKTAGPVVVKELPAKWGEVEAWPGLPQLRSLELTHSHRLGSQLIENGSWDLWKWITSLPVARQLAALTVSVGLGASTGKWEEVFTLCPSLRTLTFIDPGQARWTFIREGKGFALRHGLADSRMNKFPTMVDGHHTERVVNQLPRLQKMGVTRIEVVDTLGSQNKWVARVAENVAKKNVLPTTFLPGAFPPAGACYELISFEVKRQQRFAKAAKTRK